MGICAEEMVFTPTTTMSAPTTTMLVHLVLLVLAFLALLAVVLLLRNSCPTWREASSTVSATTSVALSTTKRLAKPGAHQLSLTLKMVIAHQADLPKRNT